MCGTYSSHASRCVCVCVWVGAGWRQALGFRAGADALGVYAMTQGAQGDMSGSLQQVFLCVWQPHVPALWGVGAAGHTCWHARSSRLGTARQLTAVCCCFPAAVVWQDVGSLVYGWRPNGAGSWAEGGRFHAAYVMLDPYCPRVVPVVLPQVRGSHMCGGTKHGRRVSQPRQSRQGGK